MFKFFSKSTVVYALVVLIFLEIVIYLKKEKKYPFVMSVNAVACATLREVFIRFLAYLGIHEVSIYLYQYKLFNFGEFTPIKYIFIFLAIDYLYYWVHRLNHQIRFFWIAHSVHHIPAELTIATSVQQTILLAYLTPFPLISIPITLLGVPPKITLTLFSFNLLYQSWLHNIVTPRLRVLETFLNTPQHHRIHHSLASEHEFKNFGGVLNIFDRIHGTYKIDNSKNHTYGIRQKIHSLTATNNSIRAVLNYEWTSINNLILDLRNASSVKQKFKILKEVK